MSSASKSSLDNDWELATARSRSSTHPTVTSDDELDTMSLPADADADDPSDLGDDAWEGIDEDSELESPFETSQQPVKPELTPHQSSRPLSADADDAEGAPSDLSTSASGTDSTFSFHFPDPLEASKEYATYPAEPAVPSELGDSDGETNSVAETDAVMGMSIGALERSRSATLVLPRSSNSISPPIRVATSIYSSSRFALSFAAGIAIAAIAIACVTFPGSYHEKSVFPRNHIMPSPSIMDTLLATMLPTEPPIPMLTTASTGSPISLIETPVRRPDLPSYESSLGLEPPPSPPRTIDSNPSSTASPPRDTALSMNPVKLVASSLSTTYTSFSKLVLRDLHDVLQAIDELLQYLRSHTIADAVEHSKRSIVEYIAQKLADRHERAKTNARKLTNRGMELMRKARDTVA